MSEPEKTSALPPTAAELREEIAALRAEGKLDREQRDRLEKLISDLAARKLDPPALPSQRDEVEAETEEAEFFDWEL